MWKKIFFYTIVTVILIPLSYGAEKNGIKYQSSFGKCPSESTGKLTLKLMSNYEKHHSLKKLKELLIKDHLKQKFFLSYYHFTYNPVRKFLNLNFDCPTPLMKVQVYKENGVENYEAILVEGGELYDPTYEVLLRAENKIKYQLPFFALPIDELGGKLQKKIAKLISSTDNKFRRKIAEVIYTEGKELTVILSIRNRSCTAFFGKSQWDKKIRKLRDMVNYLAKNRKIPITINITNLQKPVAKFTKTK